MPGADELDGADSRVVGGGGKKLLVLTVFGLISKETAVRHSGIKQEGSQWSIWTWPLISPACRRASGLAMENRTFLDKSKAPLGR